MDGLSHEDIARLSAPFQPHEYGIRVGTEDKKDGKYVMWLVYVEEDAIVDRLNEATPNWSFEIRNVQSGDGYIAAYGRLTINGISREGVGTGSPDTGSKIGENEEKGAATDALKRCARLFGIGLELKREEFGRIYTEGPSKDKGAKAEALRKFTAEYNKVFGGNRQQPTPPASSKPAPNIPPLSIVTDATPATGDVEMGMHFLADSANRHAIYEYAAAVFKTVDMKIEPKEVVLNILKDATSAEINSIDEFMGDETEVKAQILARAARYEPSNVSKIGGYGKSAEAVNTRARAICVAKKATA